MGYTKKLVVVLGFKNIDSVLHPASMNKKGNCEKT
jgi:hypothetical protein